MQTAETLLAISNQRIGPLEIRMTRKCVPRNAVLNPGSSVLKCEAWDFSLFCRSQFFC